MVIPRYGGTEVQDGNALAAQCDLFFHHFFRLHAPVKQYLQIKLDDEEYQIYRDEAVQLRFSVKTSQQLASYVYDGRIKLSPGCIKSVKLPSCRTLLASSKRSEAAVALPEDTR